MKTHSHQWLDRRSLALHRLIAEKIRRDPDLFENVKRTLARWSQIVCANSQPYVKEWQRLVDLGKTTKAYLLERHNYFEK